MRVLRGRCISTYLNVYRISSTISLCFKLAVILSQSHVLFAILLTLARKKLSSLQERWWQTPTLQLSPSRTTTTQGHHVDRGNDV
jgi:hypothetical protein